MKYSVNCILKLVNTNTSYLVRVFYRRHISFKWAFSLCTYYLGWISWLISLSLVWTQLSWQERKDSEKYKMKNWLAEIFSPSPPKQLNEIQQKLTGSKIFMCSTKFVFSSRSENKMTARPLIGLNIFALSSETTERNSTKKLTGSNLSSCSTMFVFFVRSEKQDDRPGLWLAETFYTPLKPLNGIHGIQRIWTGSKISTSSTKFVFSGRSKKRWPPWPLIGWYIFDPPSEREFNDACQEARSQRPQLSLCFSGRSENKMAALASYWLIHFRLPLLKPLNGIERHFKGSKILTSST